MVAALAFACRDKAPTSSEARATETPAAPDPADGGLEPATTEVLSASLVIVLPDGATKDLGPSALKALAIDRFASRRQLRGWLLADVLALASSAPFAAARFSSADGEAIEIASSKLFAPGARAVLRYNKRGLIKFSVWQLGGEKPVLLEAVAGLTRIELKTTADGDVPGPDDKPDGR